MLFTSLTKWVIPAHVLNPCLGSESRQRGIDGLDHLVWEGKSKYSERSLSWKLCVALRNDSTEGGGRGLTTCSLPMSLVSNSSYCTFRTSQAKPLSPRIPSSARELKTRARDLRPVSDSSAGTKSFSLPWAEIRVPTRLTHWVWICHTRHLSPVHLTRLSTCDARPQSSLPPSLSFSQQTFLFYYFSWAPFTFVDGLLFALILKLRPLNLNRILKAD